MKMPFVRLKRCAAIMIFVSALSLFFAGAVFCSSGGESGPKGWVATDTYRVMNFVVLAVGLFLLLRKPASGALADRINGIKEELRALESKKTDAEKKLAQYNEKLALLNKDAEKIIAEQIKQGNEAKNRIVEAAGSAALKLEEQARRNIEHEFKQARLKLQEEVVGKALIKAEEIIKSKITGKDQEQLVSEYLAKVVA
ncbi:MAG: F-type H+-transporting ATPase subunit b [Thermodesulfobacteriota bacterium]|nr:F-type H+-transporting ATPase subunit b [Thermodesulfobacteriota bacterium]